MKTIRRFRRATRPRPQMHSHNKLPQMHCRANELLPAVPACPPPPTTASDRGCRTPPPPTGTNQCRPPLARFQGNLFSRRRGFKAGHLGLRILGPVKRINISLKCHLRPHLSRPMLGLLAENLMLNAGRLRFSMTTHLLGPEHAG